MLEPDREPSRYWCCFGTENPTHANNLTIVGEINPTKEGVNRRNAGIFLRDNQGVVYLAHSGKVGGGRVGIGKNRFFDFYHKENNKDVDWPDKIQSSAIVIGRIDSEHLPAQIAHFIRQVEIFKEETAGERTQGVPSPESALTFTPEFSGKRQGYIPKGKVEANCDHGLVVDGLAEFMKGRGIKFANDRRRDFLILSRGGTITHLFEVKTDTSTSSLYTAIGQLMLHGAALANTPKKVLVLPDEPKQETLEAIRRLGIRVVTYEWVDTTPIFHHLEGAIT
jgi:hypothetical protein